MRDEVARAVEVLRDGGLVAFPTETVYGLGADATNTEAVAQVFTVKRRPPTHPLIVHLADVGDLDEWAREVPDSARALARACWPGPLTLLLRRSGRAAEVVTGGRDTIGLRVPDHPVALELLRAFDGGVAAPSANRFGAVSPTTAGHVRADLGEDVGFVLDGGPCRIGVESTIVDFSGGTPEVLRPGGVSFEKLRDVLGHPVDLWLGDRDVAAPGTLDAHYAPNATVELVDADRVVERAEQHVVEGRRVGVLAPGHVDGLSADVVELEPAGGPDEYARVLYDRLRQADRLGLEHLIVIGPRPEGVGVAVLDRLRKAAASSS